MMDFEKLKFSVNQADQKLNKSLFKIRSANECLEEAKAMPIPKMLFGELWHEGELCILFADTGIGKSILAVQIGESIASSKLIEGFKKDAGPQKVAYFDFELSDKQFQNRYSEDYKNEYEFSGIFERITFDEDYEYSDNIEYSKLIEGNIIDAINRTGAKILILDNITYLKHGGFDKADHVLPLMKFLKKIKSQFNLSILVLAHTPKRDNSRPISINDLQGSKQFANFADCIFAINKSSQGEHLRYLKQLKVRACENLYHSENVIVCELLKKDSFLKFQFIGYSIEYDHLKKASRSTDERNQEIIDLHKDGMSNVKIAEKYSLSEGAIRKIIKKHNETF